MSKGKFLKVAVKQSLQHQESRYTPVATKKPSLDSSNKWRFSFRLFREIEKFGLSGRKIENGWMISLLERLKNMENVDIRDYVVDPVMAQQNRFHHIDWNAKNIPIKIENLDWIPSKYIENQQEFPICQFQLSTGKGRVVGFFDEFWIFQIVLLDPLHNIQPSANYDYIVDHCTPLGSAFHALEKKIDGVISKAPECDCGVVYDLKQLIQAKSNGTSIVLALYCDKTIQDVIDLINMDSNNLTITEIFLAGVEEILKKNLNTQQ